MLALGLDLLAIAAAPWLANRSPNGRWPSFIDAFSRVAVVGIVAVHVLPHALHELGGVAFAVIAAGFLGITTIEQRDEVGSSSTLVLALGLGLHQLLDGVALATEEAGALLGLAIVAHTLPISWLTWRETRRRGPVAASAVLAGMAAAVLAGFGLASHLPGEDSWFSALSEALVGGALLHLGAHPTATGAPHAGASGAGALAGAAAVVAVGSGHPIPAAHATELASGTTASTLWFDAAPALLVGYVLSAALQLTAPAQPAAPTSGRLAQAIAGLSASLRTPLCSCGALPVYERLVHGGTPVPTAIALLVAGPELAAPVALVSLPLLGGPITALRLGGAAFAALLAATAVGAAPTSPGRSDATAASASSFRARMTELIDHSAPWILVGLGAAAVLEPSVPADALTALPAPLHPVVFALLGVPAYLCAAGATPIAAMLLHKGLTVGGALALLITGPAVQRATRATLVRLHGPDTARRYTAAVVAAAIGLGWVVDLSLAAPAWASELHHRAELRPDLISFVLTAILTGLFGRSLLRQGLTGFVEQVVHPDSGDGHHHHHVGCDHGACDHGHVALVLRPAPDQAPVIRLDVDLP